MHNELSGEWALDVQKHGCSVCTLRCVPAGFRLRFSSSLSQKASPPLQLSPQAGAKAAVSYFIITESPVRSSVTHQSALLTQHGLCTVLLLRPLDTLLMSVVCVRCAVRPCVSLSLLCICVMSCCLRMETSLVCVPFPRLLCQHVSSRRGRRDV